jgi:hypothetical protein
MNTGTRVFVSHNCISLITYKGAGSYSHERYSLISHVVHPPVYLRAALDHLLNPINSWEELI